MRFPAYPRYKPSGVEWLGDVPAHWLSLPLRRIATTYAGGTPDRTNDDYWLDGTIPWINSGAVNQGLILEPSAFITVEAFNNSSAKWVPSGALVIALAGQGKTKATVAQMGIAATCNQSMAAMCPLQSMSARFLFWLLTAQYFEIRNMAGGEQRDGLNLELLGSVPCLGPPPAEQSAIAAFLNRRVGQIDLLIAKKRELIERLMEKRTALISRTVTRGLPPGVARSAGIGAHLPFRSSGIEWLGDNPSYWQVKQLKWTITFQRGHDLPVDDREAGEIPLVTSAGISAGVARAIAKGPGIVTGRYGTIGVFHLVKNDYWPLNTTLYSVELHNNDPGFLCYMLTHLSPLFLLNSVKSAVPGIDRNDIHPIRTALPPIWEQRAIADYLDAETGKLDALVAKVEAAIERLQEYRAALITAAVTGKIDVRGRAA